MPISNCLDTKIRLTMLYLSGLELKLFSLGAPDFLRNLHPFILKIVFILLREMPASRRNVFHLHSLMNLQLLNKQIYLLLNSGKTSSIILWY